VALIGANRLGKTILLFQMPSCMTCSRGGTDTASSDLAQKTVLSERYRTNSVKIKIQFHFALTNAQILCHQRHWKKIRVFNLTNWQIWQLLDLSNLPICQL